jgi:hypothetical protein
MTSSRGHQRSQILIDRGGIECFAFRTSSTEYGDVRRYYCAQPPWRAILVCRNGLDLHDLVALW